MRRPPATRFCMLATVMILAAACGDDGSGGDPEPTESAGAGTEEVDVACEVRMPTEDGEPGEPTEPALRQELLDMQEADQADRTSGDWDVNNDIERTERLREIIDEYGWPTPDMVGDEGSSAAWLIAQHSDLDVDLQREVLDLMCDAVANGDADPTELAYLEDRVALNSGGQQVYGTQIGCEDGEAVPAPLADEEGVHERRELVGLQPLGEYLAELEDDCAAELED